MKRIGVLLSALVCSILLLGAATPAPVVPTKGYYVNDYADIVFREHRTEITRIAHEVLEETGIELVVLTVRDLSGMTIEDYASLIGEDWEIGGPDKTGILLLISEADQACHILAGSGAVDIISSDYIARVQQEFIDPYFSKGNYSTGILNAYKSIANRVYAFHSGDEETLAQMEEAFQATGSTGGVSFTTMILFGVALMAVLWSFFLYNRYKKKYLYRNQPVRKDFSVERPDFDDVPEKRRRRFEEDEDPPVVQRKGFIIYRNQDPNETEEKQDNEA